MALEYHLTAQVAGVGTWNDLPPRDVNHWIFATAFPSSTTISQVGLGATSTGGTITGVICDSANFGKRMFRVACPTSAVAGNYGNMRSTGGSGPVGAAGVRWDIAWTLGAPSTNWRWLAGIGGATLNTNTDPNTLTSCIVVGRRNGEANAQLMNNDAAGTCVQTDLGAAFSATALDTAYRLQLYTPIGGASYVYQLTQLGTKAQISGTLTTEIPANTAVHLWTTYFNNNTDAAAVSLHFSYARCGHLLSA